MFFRKKKKATVAIQPIPAGDWHTLRVNPPKEKLDDSSSVQERNRDLARQLQFAK